MEGNNLMKKSFLWYYSMIWLSLGAISNFLDWVSYGEELSFWGVVVAMPTIYWLAKESE